MTLDVFEFLRRFLLHVLPERLCKIRYYGFLSNRHRIDQLGKCKELLDVPVVLKQIEKKTWEELFLELTGVDIRICPACHKGKMRSYHVLEPVQNAPP